jgi:hypothetical protein
MPFTENPFDRNTLPEDAQVAIEAKASEWGVSFEDACVRLLVQRSRELQGQPAPARLNLFTRLFRSQTAH